MTRECHTGDHLLAHDLRESWERRVQRSIMTCLRQSSGEAVSALPVLRECLKTGSIIRADSGTVFEGETAAAMHRRLAEREMLVTEERIERARHA